MTRRRSAIWLLVVFVLALTGCRRGAGQVHDVSVDLSIHPNPPQVGPATVTVFLHGAEGQPITGAVVQLEGNMSHAGMKPVFADAQEVTPGRYRATLEFTMGGDWFIIVRASLPDGRSLERQIEVPGVRTP